MVVYDPESPYSLLGIPFLGRYFAKNDEANEFDNDTWIRSASTNSLFQWDHGKHQRHFAHGSSHLPELLTNEGETYFNAFCTRISKFMDDKINYAFSSAFTMSPDGVPQPHVIWYQMMMTMKLMKFNGIHLHIHIKIKIQIKVFVSENQQNHPHQFRIKFLTWISS
jgi:hypothetical protein